MKTAMEQLFETEKQKWLKKSYGELKKLYAEHDLYSYVLKVNDQQYPANVLMLEIEEEYIHPSLTVYDCEDRSRFFGLLDARHNCSIDWIVDKDNTVHA